MTSEMNGASLQVLLFWECYLKFDKLEWKPTSGQWMELSLATRIQLRLSTSSKRMVGRLNSQIHPAKFCYIKAFALKA